MDEQKPFQIAHYSNHQTHLVGINYSSNVLSMVSERKTFDDIIQNASGIVVESNERDIINMQRSRPLFGLTNFGLYAFEFRPRPKHFLLLDNKISWYDMVSKNGMEAKVFQTLDAYGIIYYAMIQGMVGSLEEFAVARGRYELEELCEEPHMENRPLQKRLKFLLEHHEEISPELYTMFAEQQNWFAQVQEFNHQFPRTDEFVKKVSGQKLVVVYNIHFERMDYYLRTGISLKPMPWESHLDKTVLNSSLRAKVEKLQRLINTL